MLTYHQMCSMAFTKEQYHKEMLMSWICNMCSKITLLKLLQHPPGTNEWTNVLVKTRVQVYKGYDGRQNTTISHFFISKSGHTPSMFCNYGVQSSFPTDTKIFLLEMWIMKLKYQPLWPSHSILGARRCVSLKHRNYFVAMWCLNLIIYSVMWHRCDCWCPGARHQGISGHNYVSLLSKLKY